LTEELNEKILKAIEDADPLAFGDIIVSTDSAGVTVTGRLHTAIDKAKVFKIMQKIVEDVAPGTSFNLALEVPQKGLKVRTRRGKTITEATNRRRETKPLDEIETIYYGMMKTSELELNPKYKRVNHETYQRLIDIVRVLNFIEPIIVDKNYKIIDGNLRLEVAQKLKIKEVPVVVIDDDGIKSDFIRLAKNRITEFQRWRWDEVDEFVDSVPQAQPLLEPLGFFGDKILPTSYFANTVLNYELDEFNDQQKKYSQDIGLAQWAEMRRKQQARQLKAKEKAKEAKKITSETKSLFDLTPKPKDFLETYNAEEEIEKNTESMKELAGKITENFDNETKAKKEAEGKVWQNTRRTSQQLADDKRAAAAEKKKAEKKSKKKKD